MKPLELFHRSPYALWIEQFTRLLWDQQVMSCCVRNTQEQQQLFRQGVKLVDLVQKHPVSWHGGAVKLKNWRWSWVIDINPAVLIFPSWWAWVTLQRWTYSAARRNAGAFRCVHLVRASSEEAGSASLPGGRLFMRGALQRYTGEPTTEGHRSSHQCLPNVIPVTHVFRII